MSCSDRVDHPCHLAARHIRRLLSELVLAHPLALVRALASAVAQHDRTQPTPDHDILINRRRALPEQARKTGQTSGYSMPTPDHQDQPIPKPLILSPSVDRG